MIDPTQLAEFMPKSGASAKAAAQRRGSNGSFKSPDSLAQYLANHDVVVKARKQIGDGGIIFILDGCPMNNEHGHGSDTAVIWRESGIGFECKHHSCSHFTWRDVRDRINPHAEQPTGGSAQRQISQVIDLTRDAELFHAEDRAYATVPNGAHRETYAVEGRRFKLWLRHAYYVATGGSPKPEALASALDALAARALFAGPQLRVALRIAEHGGAIWLDLCDSEWRVVRIDAGGWRVNHDSPVRFLRRPGMLSLPIPVPGGSISEFRTLINLPDEPDRVLLLAWLAAALRPEGPHPVLVVNGEQGSAKSTLCRMVRRLIDPNRSDVRAAPHELRDLAITASNSWILALDNISRIQPWLSDGLCRLSTGAGFSTRKLYTDEDEQVFELQRPVLLNGIEDFVERPDLLDRAIVIRLPTIPEALRRDEHTLWREFEAGRPRILGALLDAVVRGLRHLPIVEMARKPRMADFAKWGIACEQGFGLPHGAFLRAYERNRDAANELALEGSPVAAAVTRLIDCNESWHGTTAELLKSLEQHTDESIRKLPDWPRSAKKLGGDLRRLAPNLRKAGFDVGEPEKFGPQRRLWRVTKVPAERAQRAQCAGDRSSEPPARVCPDPIRALLRFRRRASRPTRRWKASLPVPQRRIRASCASRALRRHVAADSEHATGKTPNAMP